MYIKKLLISIFVMIFFSNYAAEMQTTKPSHNVPNVPFSFTINLPAITQNQIAQPTTTITDHGTNTEITNKPATTNNNNNQNELLNTLQITTIISLLQQLQTTLQKNKPLFFDALRNLWRCHSTKLIISGALLAYALCYARIWLDNRYIADQTLWCYWQDYSRDDIGNITNVPETSARLLRAIQTKYLSATQPTDHLCPLVLFMKDMSKQEERITRYIWYTRYINATPLQRILSCSDADTQKAEELLAQLRVVKALFNNWLAWYNSTQFYTNISTSTEM